MRVSSTYPQVRSDLAVDTEEALAALFQQMQPQVAARYDAGAQVLIARSWIAKLTDLIENRHMTAAEAVGSKLASDANYPDFDPEVMRAWLALNAGFTAEGVLANAEDSIRKRAESDHKPEDENPAHHVFDTLRTSGAARLAVSLTTVAANFAARDTAEKAGAKTKTWHTNSSNPRKSHARMNGQTVAIERNFSNGLKWPGDPDGKAEETVECHCSVSFVI